MILLISSIAFSRSKYQKHCAAVIQSKLLSENGVFSAPETINSMFFNKKLREPFLPTFTEAETPQVTTAKLPYGTRKHPLRAATFLS